MCSFSAFGRFSDWTQLRPPTIPVRNHELNLAGHWSGDRPERPPNIQGILENLRRAQFCPFRQRRTGAEVGKRDPFLPGIPRSTGPRRFPIAEMAKEWRQRKKSRETTCPHSFAAIPLPTPPLSRASGSSGLQSSHAACVFAHAETNRVTSHGSRPANSPAQRQSHPPPATKKPVRKRFPVKSLAPRRATP